MNETVWNLMKQRDAALKKSLKTGLLTDSLLYKELRNKVTCALRLLLVFQIVKIGPYVSFAQL